MSAISDGPSPHPQDPPTSTGDDEATLFLRQRLIGEYGGAVPVADVMRCVDEAREAVRYFGQDSYERVALVERIARSKVVELVAGSAGAKRRDSVRPEGGFAPDAD